MSLKRVDQILSELFPEFTRSKVQSLIASQSVQFRQSEGRWMLIQKPGLKLDSELLSADHFLIHASEELDYVSRGALKLKGALKKFDIAVVNKVCLDVGLSTGGFSDLLLRGGALKILGVDVGQGQLHHSLRSHPKLVAVDKINARNPLPQNVLDLFFAGMTQNLFDLIVVDVSFISLNLIVPNLKHYLAPSGLLICLVKPQFELQKVDLNKKGVVKDPRNNLAALNKIIEVFKQQNLDIIGHCPSPIEGEHGNQEYLLLAHSLNTDASSSGM